MATENRVFFSVNLPVSLGGQIEQAASDDHVTPDKFVQQAVERQLLLKRHQALQGYGHSKARESGITESDVQGLVAELRQDQLKRKR